MATTCYDCKKQTAKLLAQSFYNSVDSELKYFCDDCWNKRLERVYADIFGEAELSEMPVAA